jgi:hypothetical protein
MTPLARIGLVGAALALPLGALVVSYVSGADPRPDAPAEVRIGGPGGQPSSREAVRAPAVFEQPAEIRTAPDAALPGPEALPARPATVVSALPPVVVDGEPPGAAKSAAAKAKSKSRSDSGANPPGRGRVSTGNG